MLSVGIGGPGELSSLLTTFRGSNEGYDSVRHNFAFYKNWERAWGCVRIEERMSFSVVHVGRGKEIHPSLQFFRGPREDHCGDREGSWDILGYIQSCNQPPNHQRGLGSQVL